MIKKKLLVWVMIGSFLATFLLIGCGKKENALVESLVDTTQQLAEEGSEEGSVVDIGIQDTGMQDTGAENGADNTDTLENKEALAQKEPFVSNRAGVFELLSHINVGWNLGNTLDAHGMGNNINSETYWGNPKTTQEMIDAVAAQGFNAIRIPITFAEHVDIYNDYAITGEWLDRIQEVVDYAYNRDMYVLIDTHHEPDFWLKPDYDHEKRCVAELSAIWTQVAERFRDYDEHLIFEGMNEPRNKGSVQEWNGGSADERKVVDHLNQIFVDAVRATGGNNEERLLIICAYGNNASYNVLKELKIPEDNNIAVAVHMYTPYQFTYEADGGYSAWDGSQKNSIVSTLKQIDKYLIQKDVPVIVTEFGAVNKNNPQDIISWIGDYMSSMNKYGIKCFWWDNNLYNSTGENFGIFDRQNLTWFNQQIADAIIGNSI